MIEPQLSTSEAARHAVPSGLIHDLRTPLNLIIGYSEMLIEQAQEQGHDDFVPDLQKTLTAGKQLLALINANFHPIRALDRPADITAPREEHTTSIEQEPDAEAFSEYAAAGELTSGSAQGFLLVVDDIEANRDVLSRRLERHGYVVATAENGRLALEMLRADNFDLVLLDIMMPEMDGYEVLQRLKADEALRYIPVIMISALSEFDSVLRCIEMGAEEYLLKPFNPTLLKARIGACLQKKRAIQTEREHLEKVVKERTLALKTANADLTSANLRLISATEKAQRMAETALAASDAKSEFLANMSHEIRTPMNGVIGIIDLLLDTNLTAAQREFGQTIQSSADALLLIINDILDFSKIEAHKLTFEVLDFDLIDTVETTLDLLAERAYTKDIELASEMSPHLPTRLRGDPGRLRQILFNLIGNAIKFTEKGEVVIRVFKESETERHALLRFNVEDTGIGISPTARTRLFERFSQADGSTTRKYGGTGLGLAISKQLVTLMHGQIGVQSKPGHGSNFWFTAQFEKQGGDAKSARKSNHDLLDVRVLVVDDNATNCKILRHQILAWKILPGGAASGAEALEFLRAAAVAGKPYDLALLDVQMPEMDGLTLARAIKADPAIAGTRLIVLTSVGHAISAAEFKKIGIEAYLVKPVRQSPLFDCLVNVMGKSTDENAVASSAGPVPAPIFSDPNPKVENVRILLAEDNIVNQKVALAQLQKLRYKANTVANGLEVLEALQQISYDIILMDCQMPEMDGYEATRAIRKREKSADQGCSWRSPVYIIAMTANAMQGDNEKCFAAGMDDYLSKPARISELQTALERWKLTQNQPNRATIPGDG